MKKLMVFAFWFAVQVTAFAQAPQAFTYQGVARNVNTGAILKNRPIALQISILQGNINGAAVYTETHNVTTDKLGVFDLAIGAGQTTLGNFADIAWGNGSYFLQLGIDANGGSNFELAGATQLLSVPYALYAEKSGSGGNSQWSDNDAGIHYNDGNVGIGTSEPNSAQLNLLTNSFTPVLSSSSEVLMQGEVQNATGDLLRIMNSTNLANQFIPTIWGHHQTDNRFGLIMVGSSISNFDSQNSESVLRFEARNNSNPDEAQSILNRPLFSWTNNTDVKMLMSANGNLGIGTITPNNGLLQLTGSSLNPVISTSQEVLLFGEVKNADGDNFRLVNGTNLSNQFIPTLWGHHQTDNRFALIMVGSSITQYDLSTSDAVVRFEARNNSDPSSAQSIQRRPLFSWTNSTDTKMIMSANGNLGIGTTVPKSKLQVTQGDVFIENADRGVIMKSPNGGCWRMTISDAGQPVFTNISCPQ